MTKELTKEQFRQMVFPIKGNGKDNVYKIEIKEFDDLVILEKINATN